MSNLKDENKKQSNTIKEETQNFLDQQKQQMANTTSNISNTTNRVNDNFNTYQKTNNEIIEKVLILLTNINKKPLTQFNQSQTTL